MKEKIAIILLLLLGSSPAFCQEFLMARVLTIDPEALELTVVTPADPDSQITVRIAEKNVLPQSDQGIFFPRCVAQGSTIRIWGTREELETPLFVASEIRGCGGSGCSDPTGVRLRLRKDRKHKKHSECGNSGSQ